VTESNETVSGALLGAIQVEGGMGLLIVATHRDEVADYVDLVKAMAGTFQLVLPAQ
jgi:hypothetical protein